MANDEGFLYRTLNAIEENLFGALIGAFILGSIGTWTYNMYSTYRETETQKARIQAGLELKVGDFNGNQTLDKYYEIDGQKVPIEIDGKPLAECLK